MVVKWVYTNGPEVYYAWLTCNYWCKSKL